MHVKTVLAQDHCYSDDLSEKLKDKGIDEVVKMLTLWREMEQWEFGFLMVVCVGWFSLVPKMRDH